MQLGPSAAIFGLIEYGDASGNTLALANTVAATDFSVTAGGLSNVSAGDVRTASRQCVVSISAANLNKITIKHPGLYRCRADLSLTGANTISYTLELWKNGAILAAPNVPLSQVYTTLTASPKATMVLETVLYLNEDDYIQHATKSSDGSDPTAFHASLLVERIG